MPDTPLPLPDFVSWPIFPFEGDLRVRPLDPPVIPEPPREGEDLADCKACASPDDAYIWVSDRWRVRAMNKPSGLPMVLILESRSHLDLGDLPNLLAAELGVLIVRLERAIRSLDGVARVHVNRWGDGAAHLYLWFLARPYGQMQLRGSFLSMWQDILPPVPEPQWREDLALVAAWLAEFGGQALAEPPRIEWRAPSRVGENSDEALIGDEATSASASAAPGNPVASGPGLSGSVASNPGPGGPAVTDSAVADRAGGTTRPIATEQAGASDASVGTGPSGGGGAAGDGIRGDADPGRR